MELREKRLQFEDRGLIKRFYFPKFYINLFREYDNLTKTEVTKPLMYALAVQVVKHTFILKKRHLF